MLAIPSSMNATDFSFENQLGTGAFSKVFVGLYRPTGVRYAVKLISKETILNAGTEEERIKMAQVARRESRMLLMCDHPNIVRFFGSMQTSEDLVYVTELCEGGELLDAIRRRGRIPLEASRHAIAELLSAIFYLHYGLKKPSIRGEPPSNTIILHRDIKPENIMLSAKMHIKLIDFGTAVVCESASDHLEGEESAQGRAQTFCGTTYYMSPELLQYNYTCCASDYWSCGCVLYYMLLGRRPFDAPAAYVLIQEVLKKEPDYPDDLDPLAKDLIQKMLIKSPEDRITMDDIKKHPFFATINFGNLMLVDVEDLWARETPWVDAVDAMSCKYCSKNFSRLRTKDYCRYCGNYFCYSCLTKRRVISMSRDHAAQIVCDLCCKKLDEQ